MNKRLTSLKGKKKPPHYVGEDRDGEDIPHVTNWNKRIYSNLRLHFDYTSTEKSRASARLVDVTLYCEQRDSVRQAFGSIGWMRLIRRHCYALSIRLFDNRYDSDANSNGVSVRVTPVRIMLLVRK